MDRRSLNHPLTQKVLLESKAVIRDGVITSWRYGKYRAIKLFTLVQLVLDDEARFKNLIKSIL